MLTDLPLVSALPLAAIPVPRPIAPTGDDVRTKVRQLLRGLQPAAPSAGPERRSDQRALFPYPVSLVPVDRETLAPLGPKLVVLGKHLAEQGLDFYHRDPLPYRYMAAELTCPNGATVRFLLELHWCRFNQHGLYENGGRFVQCLK